MKNYAPYQFFFPLGVLCALLSVGIWVADDLITFTVPTMLIHSKLVTGGFIWCFIVGFLMTAVPRLTGTNSASVFEMLVASLLLLQQVTSSWFIDHRWFYSASMALVIFLASFAIRRLRKHKRKLPVFISHILLGLILAFTGAFFHFKGDSLMGLHLYQIGTILLLILGIGTRFFSFLSGLPSVFEENNSLPTQIMFHGLGVGVAVSLFMAGKGFSWAYLSIALLSTCYLLFVWKIFRKSDRPSALKYAVRIVACMIPLTFFLCWLFPTNLITWLHFLFIGCFALLTFSVATRVILAHGSYSTDLETTTVSLWAFFAFISISLLLRVSYGLATVEIKDYLLHFAVIFWIGSILIWSSSFFIKIFIPGPQAKPSC